jgi:hypothetical protein
VLLMASSMPGATNPFSAGGTPSTGHTSVLMGGTTPSGESTPYTMLGSALVAGGVGGSMGSGKKRVNILISPNADEFCMGLINNSKFCTRKNLTCAQELDLHCCSSLFSKVSASRDYKLSEGH